MKIIKALGLILFGLVLIGFVGFSSFVGNQVAEGLVFQNSEKDTQAASVYQLNEWAYDLSQFKRDYEIYDKQIVAEDGVEVPFSILGDETLSKKRTVILVHGLGGDRVCVYPQAEMYLKQDFNVIALDQRASGLSQNEWVTFGYYEQLDVKAVVDYIRQNTLESQIYIHGFSMGGATAGLYSETDHAKEYVKGIVMDSSFSSMKDMFLIVWEQMDTGMPGEYAVMTGDIFLKIRFGFGFEEADVKAALMNSQVPVMLIQSRYDDLVPVAVANEMFEAIGHEDKKMWLVDSKHIEGYIDFPIEYTQEVMTFIETLD